ncbi:S8 family serine peptidase [Bdellovibrio sp. HCB209]|uniref:S8 family serine peptidase n=1 Tax=Bdellovibrio sp. HCB209 TaxID=3394354 RepID=UPI0039B4ED67
MKLLTAVMMILTVGSAQAALVPASQSGFTNDPLAKYQWAVFPADQKILRDQTDIRSKEARAVSGRSADVQARADGFSKVMKKDIVVALLDSGVEVQHTDLAKSLYHNDSECVNGATPFRPSTDNDGNGYKGDCIGWNFMASAGANNENLADDDLGHGTHVAGIIAAQIGNAQGVAGVTNRVRLLPLKVTGAADANAGSGVSASTALTGRVLKALRYALAKRVDVVNISMGWPAATDTPELRKVFADLQDAGVFIVAAAGNNNNNNLNFPCSYPGVLCVAATGIDNVLTGFSNFGGQVDMAAPGEEILSTYPNSKTPTNFSVKGYEVLSGTSQAAPFVTAAVAVLKGTFPGITADEIKARLFASTQSVDGEKFIRYGTLKIAKALEQAAVPVVAPEFKNLSRVLFKNADGVARFTLPIKNYWKAQDQVAVQVKSLSANFRLQEGADATLSLGQGQVQSLAVAGRIQDTSESGTVRLSVTVRTSANTKNFVHEFSLSREVKNDADVVKVPLAISGDVLPSALRNVMTVNDVMGVSENPDYYLTETSSEKMRVSLLQLQGRRFQQSVISLPQGTRNILSFMKVPLSNDMNGYWIGTLATAADGKTKTMSYLVMSEDLRSVRQEISFVPETVVLDRDAVASLRFASLAKTGLVPVFSTIGKIPKQDINPDPFQFESNNPQRRVFYLKPVASGNSWTYQTRNFDNYKFQNDLRAQLGIGFQYDLRLLTMLPQSVYDVDRIRMLYSYGTQDLQKYVVVETRGEWLDQRKFTLKPLSFSSTMMSNGVPAPVTDLTDGVAVKNANWSFGVFLTPIKAQNLIFDSYNQLQSEIILQSSSTQDLLISYIQSFRRGNEFFTFAQSKSNLIMQVNSSNGKTRRYESSIHRATWPGLSSTELLYPSVVQNRGFASPSIYVDATQLYSNNVYFWTESSRGDLVSPAKLNLDIPNDCRALAPQKFSSYGNKNFAVMLCGSSAANAEMQLVPLSI